MSGTSILNNQNKIHDLNNKEPNTNNQNKICGHIKSYHISIYDKYNLENYIKEKIIKLSNKYQGIKFCITVNIINHFSFIAFKLSPRKICATT